LEQAVLVTRQATLADVTAIQALAHQSFAYHHTRDPRLPAEISLPVWLIFIDGGACWLASDEAGTAGVLCAEPETWYEDSPFSNVFPRSYLRLRLTLAAHADREASLAVLLARALAWPGAADSEGCLLMAPRADEALGRALAAQGFQPYHTIAIQPMRALPTPPPSSGVTIRRATRRDVRPVAGLMAESWRFHAAHQPAIRLSPRLIDGCEQQAQQLAADRDNQILLLAEQDEALLGFFAIGLSHQDPAMRPALFLRGWYGDVFEVAVKAERRRSGIGTALFHAAWDWFAAQDVAGVFVNYAPTNPISSHFWPRLGFEDAWTNWWRPHAAKH
jgi:ribosomal protein S18 acetylase RimI-like enzyme